MEIKKYRYSVFVYLHSGEGQVIEIVTVSLPLAFFVFSTKNGALHSGQGSGIGLSHVENSHFG